MKRFIAVLSGLLVMPAFAEVAPVYLDDVIEYSDAEMFDGDVVYDDEIMAEQEVSSTAAPNVPLRNSTRATRTVPSVSTAGATTRASATKSSRAVASRTATTRATANIAQTRNAMTRGTASRAAKPSTVSARRTNPATVARSGAVSITQDDTVNTPLYTGRVGTRTVTGSAVRARVPAVRVASTTTLDNTATVSVEDVTSSMDELAQITDFCKAQYTECMDNFCNVLDDNQGRCSCSKNIKNYAKTEQALKEATENLQDVAQKIQYIGLTGDEIKTLFDQTEAELALQGSSDSSQIKTDLDKIKNMIVDVKSGTASSGEVTGISLNFDGLLDFSFDSAGFDLGAFFNTTSTNTSSISNQRGEELYKTAASRCKAAVLNDCAAKGVDAAVITNSYDLEIDKQCLIYERSLTEANDQMKSTVRNAQSVLQKARLMVAQQKNSYDMRGCVNALDSCMQDDFVCGTDYENCLDPTGKYIVNGSIVVGSQPILEVSNATFPTDMCPTSGLYEVWGEGTDNAWCGSDASLSEYINNNIDGDKENMISFLMGKIGSHDNTSGKDSGMCMSVLNKCQNYTYPDGKYKADNPVVHEYLQRTLTQIKAAQDEIISDYAENCVAEVQSCLNQNGYVDGGTLKNNIAINSCRASIITCMSVNGMTSSAVGTEDMKKWVLDMLDTGASAFCGSDKVPVLKTDGSYSCQPKGNPCNSNGFYNAVTYVCETVFGDADTGKCTVEGLDGYNPVNNRCTCNNPEAPQFTVSADGTKADCCESGQVYGASGCEYK